MSTETAAPRPAAGADAPQRVLIVDDDPTFLLMASETLEASGFAVSVAASAEEAMRAFARLRPDLVLLDIALPGGNGFDLCRWIRLAPASADVPVVLVTGLDDTGSIDRAYEVGATDFMHKPVLWPMLPHRVSFILRAHDDRRSLMRSEERNRALLQALPDACVIVDRSGVITEHFSGSDAPSTSSLVGKRIEEAFPRSLAQAARAWMSQADMRATHEFAVAHGEERSWFEARFRAQPQGLLLIVIRDTTERHKSKARIEYLAYYDLLTRLPNRTLFLRRAAKALKESKRSGAPLALFYLDLDRFKRVNDNLGHTVGDDLLRQVARRLEQLLTDMTRQSRPDPLPAQALNSVARLGGDEFVLLANGLGDDKEAADIAERLRLALAEPVQLGQHQLVVTASIGIAMYPRDSTAVDDLLVKADMAMYMAKDRGRNAYAFFGQSVAVRSLGRLAMETDMRQAFEMRQFRIHYQPKLALASGRITGVEALLRWTHAERGSIAPDRFIPVAEETGLIVPLGEWVIREVCEQLSNWAGMGFEHLRAAVNVSVQQFERRDFVDSVMQVLTEFGIRGERLELEITESLLSRNIAQTKANMERFRAHGVALSIDDFGTGYSSLGYLRQLPVGALKIDRSFVRDLDRNEDAAAICAAIIALARELRLQVIAEGVERMAQFAFLKRHRCDEAQGYLIGKPMSAEDLTPLLGSIPEVASATSREREAAVQPSLNRAAEAPRRSRREGSA
ncbi:MAG TPA: EAL domain-containing protein [Steroidobacteraceae bacterium]|nr:EAL domain-containing protein [Steroidobacteraceae bacterium]